MAEKRLTVPTGIDDLLDEATPVSDGNTRQSPWMSWNVKGQDAEGERMQPDRLYHSQDNIPLENIEVSFLEVLRRGATWQRFDEKARETKRFCRSNDRKAGQRSDDAPEQAGELVACDTCGRMDWDKGRPTCTRFDDVAVYDHKNDRVWMVRFKVTGLREWNNFQRRHIHGKRTTKSGRADMPFLVYKVSFSAIMSPDGGDYAVPHFEVLGVNNKADIEKLAELRKAMVSDVLPANSEPEEKPMASEKKPRVEKVESTPVPEGELVHELPF